MNHLKLDVIKVFTFLSLFLLALFIPIPSSVNAEDFLSYPCQGCSGGVCPTAGGTGGGDLANADALTIEGIQCVLSQHPNGYNLLPYAEQIHMASHSFNINPLLLLGIANKDSSMGTAGAGADYMNPGNISYRDDLYVESGIQAHAGELGDGRWAVFDSYGDGIQAKAWLLRFEYLDAGYDTLEAIVYRYAPPSENDSAQYVQDVLDFMAEWGGKCAG
ncbi:hypothetical protein C4544_00170 [candidate division WS5 bacterium]|uniref:Mannosyl-glycoprotein endo-beta-N-acetylglucosamidase-like domain-containing protein n=1 Tax=candidate division WS5 bacterium TaxID=2093353 RepID=A0A419DGQ7_9BACT|nr:MAG: hypothetical protein C4544_00170 [candidate division WS5 bacterium]